VSDQQTEAKPRRNRFDRLAQRFAQSKPSSWMALNIANPIDKRLLPLTKGRFSIGQVTSRCPVGLLVHKGKKSGETRQTPLNYMSDRDRIVLIASQTGRPKHPAWYHNLSANPECRFMAKGEDREYVAKDAEGAERERLWTEMNDLYGGGFDLYQERTERRIPVVVLEPKP
jgi:deazaflavin-dependent oxidoreductase (nitroreductase family)